MPLIELDKETVELLQTNELLTGESPSAYIRRTFQNPKSRRTTTSSAGGSRSDLANFLQILGEVYRQYPDEFPLVASVKGRRRIYFSRNPKEIEASGSSNFATEIPESGWWVTSNTSSPKKHKILDDALRAIRCSPEERRRWLGQFTPSARCKAGTEDDDDDDPSKI